jgi:CxxC-x17-CxxC domain-containing protein
VLLGPVFREARYKMVEERAGFEKKRYKIVCSECGQEAEVPFQPAEGRPVFCRDCYQKRKPRK